MEAALYNIVLVGTPNSGKTSLFNALTGSRQKVANYPGVTVERKQGFFVTPRGRQVSLIDLPGTYSLRGRSPDEEITRDVVLGRAKGETLPELVLCVADATNLRLAIRLVLEMKHTGRPMVLALNMFDIAKRRGVTVDVPALSAALGIPVVTSIAVRKGGTDELLQLTDTIAAEAAEVARENDWRPHSVAELRATQREADRIIKETVSLPARPGQIAVDGTIEGANYLGGYTHYVVDTGAAKLRVSKRNAASRGRMFEVGQPIKVSFAAESVRILGA